MKDTSNIKITNLTSRMLVFQLTHACAGGPLKAYSENTNRLKHDRDGKMSVVKVRLRHGPVVRVAPGGISEILPSVVLREAPIKAALKARPPQIKFEYISENEPDPESDKNSKAKTEPVAVATADNPVDEPEAPKKTSRKPRRQKLSS